MKKSRGCLFVVIPLAVVLFVAAWYYGMVPVGSSSDRASLRHAVDLKILPSGVEVNCSGTESWTDYIFEVDIDVDPNSFEKLLSGRDFKLSENLLYGVESTRAYRIPGYTGFRVSEVWHWEEIPDDAPEGGMGSRCTIYTNQERNRAFIRYSSD